MIKLGNLVGGAVDKLIEQSMANNGTDVEEKLQTMTEELKTKFKKGIVGRMEEFAGKVVGTIQKLGGGKGKILLEVVNTELADNKLTALVAEVENETKKFSENVHQASDHMKQEAQKRVGVLADELAEASLRLVPAWLPGKDSVKKTLTDLYKQSLGLVVRLANMNLLVTAVVAGNKGGEEENEESRMKKVVTAVKEQFLKNLETGVSGVLQVLPGSTLAGWAGFGPAQIAKKIVGEVGPLLARKLMELFKSLMDKTKGLFGSGGSSGNPVTGLSTYTSAEAQAKSKQITKGRYLLDGAHTVSHPRVSS